MKLEKKIDTIPISTEVTDEDLENAITIDGTKYSRDKKRVLKGVDINTFHILPGTEVICDKAFCCSLFISRSNLQQITIPNTVTHIGDRAFCGCENLQQITIPNSVTHIGDDAFFDCDNLQQITIPCGFEKLLPSRHDAFDGDEEYPYYNDDEYDMLYDAFDGEEELYRLWKLGQL